MTLPSAPHITNNWLDVVYPIKPGERNSWRVYALQRGLIARDYEVMDDGDYDPGRGTEKAVRRFQEINNLVVDGIAGPATQSRLLFKVERDVDEQHPLVPDHFVYGLIMRESPGLVGATNDFDPSPKDLGTDCGCLQWRVAGDVSKNIPYDFEALKAAFDPFRAMTRACTDSEKGIVARKKRIAQAQPNMSTILQWRSVAVAHNAPFLYEQMVRNGKLSTPDAIAEWTNDGLGGHLTHQEHFEAYSTDVLRHTNLL